MDSVVGVAQVWRRPAIRDKQLEIDLFCQASVHDQLIVNDVMNGRLCFYPTFAEIRRDGDMVVESRLMSINLIHHNERPNLYVERAFIPGSESSGKLSEEEGYREELATVIIKDQDYLAELAQVTARGKDVLLPFPGGKSAGRIRLPNIELAEWVARSIRLASKHDLKVLQNEVKEAPQGGKVRVSH
jgi:hypothetical protein